MIDKIQNFIDKQLINHGYSTVALPGSVRSALYKKIQAQGDSFAHITYTDVAKALTLKGRLVKEITQKVGQSSYATFVGEEGDIFFAPKKKELVRDGWNVTYEAYKINDLGRFEVWRDVTFTPPSFIAGPSRNNIIVNREFQARQREMPHFRFGNEHQSALTMLVQAKAHALK